MKKEPIKFAAKLNKNKTAWCYACNVKKVQWDAAKECFICRNCGAVHEQMDKVNG